MPQSLLTLCLILAVTLEMRGPITSVGPLANLLTTELSLTANQYGLVASLPIIAFGLFSFIAPVAVRRFSLISAVSLFLISLAIGGFLRSIPDYGPLLAGTFMVGTGIAALNVLMPVVIKTWFTTGVRRLLGIYTGFVGLSGAIGALSAYPLASMTDLTQAPFILWALFGIVVLVAWIGLTHAARSSAQPLLRASGLYRHPGAWAMTGVMGLQSLLIYTVAAWLPPYLESQGVSATMAGTALALYLFAGLPASIFTEHFIRLCRNEWLAEALMSLSYLLGLYCWTQGGLWIYVGSILAGAPQGSMLSTAFILMAEKTRSNAALLGLSAMTQGIGYLGAGLGPIIFASLLTNGWTLALWFVAFIIALWAAVGFIASRFPTIGN